MKGKVITVKKMADRILKQNKIPGCERLTRPEEIKALSKYLRNIKEIINGACVIVIKI